MTMELPNNIASLNAPTKDDIGIIDAWAKSLHPSITVTWDEQRAAPPRRPGRGLSVEEMRAKDPGPCALTVRTIELLTGKPSQIRVTLHKPGSVNAEAGILARVELAALVEDQASRLKAHRLSLAVVNSKEPWDYPETNAKHFDLLGTLCAESVADPKYVENEKRMHELREIIKCDWRGLLAVAVETAQHLATNTKTTTGTANRAQIRAAYERSVGAGAEVVR